MSRITQTYVGQRSLCGDKSKHDVERRWQGRERVKNSAAPNVRMSEKSGLSHIFPAGTVNVTANSPDIPLAVFASYTRFRDHKSHNLWCIVKGYCKILFSHFSNGLRDGAYDNLRWSSTFDCLIVWKLGAFTMLITRDQNWSIGLRSEGYGSRK